MRPSEFRFTDRYTILEGSVLLTGLQALVRIPMDQTRKDHAAGIRIGTYVSGYQGSPLGEVEQNFQRVSELLEQYRIYFQAGVNEELAATAIAGTQLLEKVPHDNYDGVLGIWYGKGPGVDRTGDAFRHGVFMGTSKHGAVLTLAGDDPSCKSSTIPSDTIPSLYDVNIPVFYPGNQQEVLEMGLKGIGLSRFTGLWAGLKIVTDIADSGSVVAVYPEQALETIPHFEIEGQPFQKQQTLRLLTKLGVEAERQVFYEKMEAAKAYVYENQLDRVMLSSPNDRLGIISFGKTYYDVMESLRILGLAEKDLQQNGIRLYKMTMVAPVEPKRLREFAEGLEEILVVEEKRGFTEMLIRHELFNMPHHPRIFGKQDRAGQILFHAQGELQINEIIKGLANFLSEKIPGNDLLAKTQPFKAIEARTYEQVMPRQPYFCSGCPHNVSTQSPPGEVAGAGIGCHTMAMYMGRGLEFVTHMGGEGANWIGCSHFTEKEHLFQNVGDGTYFHSANKAVEACIASGVNITFKILFNSTVALTGGQDVMGMLDPLSLAKKLKIEGVKKVIIVTETPAHYAKRAILSDIRIVSKNKYDQAMAELKQIKGVSVLIYDQECAAEKRRKRNRGKMEIPRERIFINSSVCEGCGDCGEKSNCLSVIPIHTEYGRKTEIHQYSCNFDYTCLQGDCPAFMKIEFKEEAESAAKLSTVPEGQIEKLKEPEKRSSSQTPYRMMLVGIGGTGVVTTTAILAAAAYLAGKYTSYLDQTGLAQKGGAVTSNLTICDDPFQSSIRIPPGQTNLLLAFDLLATVSPDNLNRLNAQKTKAIVNTHQINTAITVTNIGATFPKLSFLQQQLSQFTQANQSIYLDANRVNEALFANEQSNNIFMLGVAYQMGTIPINGQYIEQAIRGNGAAVEQNINAFRWGRKYAQNPQETIRTLFANDQQSIDPAEMALLKLQKYEPKHVGAFRKLVAQFPKNDGLVEILYPRVSDLILYQNTKYAQNYLDFVNDVYQQERGGQTSNMPFTTTVAKWLFKLMAYKDEYEVARLWVQDSSLTRKWPEDESIANIFIYLHPPILRLLGWNKKLKLGSWILPVLQFLAKGKLLRGTFLDLFAKTEIRKMEIQLIGWYQDLVKRLLLHLTANNIEDALKIAALPDHIRGYEEIKKQNIIKTQAQAEELLKQYC